jgi:S-DNA-T family DNA segregation ATPase FtsK/SpoIIIE
VVSPKILKRADSKPRSADDQLKFHRMTTEGYEAPPSALLDTDDSKKVEIDEETLKKNSLLLEKKLRDFDVEGKVLAIHPGPVITMYEFEPKAGTKVNKIVNLQDDLSLTLGGRSVRIIPHLPGKAALGIEIPNSEREIVYLKNIVTSSQYAKSQSKLPLSLGSSTAGHPVVTDLTKMPHLLVAGATGSGKSVAINSFIINILMKSAPEDVRFILVDPKMLELSVYDGIPHLLLPVVTKAKPAVTAMKWAIREMEKRYRLMAHSGTRNILSYNQKLKSGQIELVSEERAKEMLEENREAAPHTGKLPYIVIIIDELADLMMTASQEMEESITRLAQMARAAGIHLVLATQRPSVDVITGLIKANFPARIAFKVTAKHDSRTILDAIGAETLLGNGDMLFMTPQGGNLIRIHGCYVSDSDIARVVSHLKGQGEPVYDESILAEPEGATAGGEFEEGDDELYDQAVRLVAETKQASISMVQRRLRIGYNRAARMIERMEAEGVVGPAEGSRPRQVLVGNMEA